MYFIEPEVASRRSEELKKILWHALKPTLNPNLEGTSVRRGTRAGLVGPAKGSPEAKRVPER